MFLLLYICLVFAGENYYQLLGVKKNADDETIRKQFKKLSLKYHPDKNKGNEQVAQEQFQKIVNAYEVLKDPEQRKIYDKYGEEGLNQHQQQQNSRGNNYNDIFSQFFGQGQRKPQIEQSMFQNTEVYEIDMPGLSRFFRRDHVWLILFYRNDNSAQIYKDIWTQLATKYYGIFKVAAINCASEDAICDDEFQQYELPSVLAFPANIRQQPTKYEDSINQEKFARFAISFMESFVSLVTTSTYQDFIKQELHIVLLFSNKKSTPPLLRVLSKELKGKLIFGQIRESDQELIEKFKIERFPTLMVLTNPQEYLGVIYESNDFKKDQIMKFLREYAYQPKKMQKQTTARELSTGVIKMGHCQKKDPNICVLLITDNNNEYKDLLDELASLYHKDKFMFYYVDKRKIMYSDLFDDIDDFPALVVVKPKKERYALYGGKIEQGQLQSWFDSVISGNIQFKPMFSSLDFATYLDDL